MRQAERDITKRVETFTRSGPFNQWLRSFEDSKIEWAID